MTTTNRTHSHRHLDVASLLLLLVGVVFGAFSYWLVADEGISALVLIPSIIAATTGATHITKRQAPRQ